MYSWRITKYNPKFRNNKGVYTKDEWTSLSDIGKIFNGKKLTLNDYIKIESSYIKSIISFIKVLKIPYLIITDLEKHDLDYSVVNKYNEIYSDAIINIFNNIKNNTEYDIEQITLICKLALREHLWLKLKYTEEIFIHFGYDYYMYIGSNVKNDLLIEKIKDSGLFIEEFTSPYLKQ